MNLEVADPGSLRWARAHVAAHHYLHTPPDPRTRPFCYVVRVASEPVGCLFFGRTEATCCYQGGLTYGSLSSVAAGRAAFDRWEVLNLSRVWLSPEVQPGGSLHSPEFLPGFADRKGVWRSGLASHAIRAALARVGFDYLLSRPPCFLDQPYAIRVVLSYCNTRLHRGVIYRAAGFRLARTNKAGVETWWTSSVSALDADQDRRIRALAASHPRSVRIRATTSKEAPCA